VQARQLFAEITQLYFKHSFTNNLKEENKNLEQTARLGNFFPTGRFNELKCTISELQKADMCKLKLIF